MANAAGGLLLPLAEFLHELWGVVGGGSVARVGGTSHGARVAEGVDGRGFHERGGWQHFATAVADDLGAANFVLAMGTQHEG